MRIGLARGTVLFAVLVVSGWNTAHAADPQVVRTYHLQAGLDVDTDGQVTKVDLPGEIPAVLTAPAQEAIKRWRFKPPVREGHAVTARTYAWVTLDLVKRPDGNYGVEVSYVKNGPALALQPPKWPMVPGDGRLTMEAVVTPKGGLTDIELVASEFSSPIIRKQFVLAVEDAIRRSHALPELVDGKPVATRMQIPIVFERHDGPSTDAKARADQTAGQSMPLAGEPPDPSGLAVALDSPVQPMPGSPPG
jgi:hypothetical protein